MRIDFKTIEKMQLEIGMREIAKVLIAHKKLKLQSADVSISKNFLKVRAGGLRHAEKRKGSKEEQDTFNRMNFLKRTLPGVMLRGYPETTRAIIKTDEQTSQNTILVEGYGLKACMATDGVDGMKTRTNNVMETREILGIEAARKTIIDEISLVMGDMDIDPRHMQLLADVMTSKGEVLGITRFGLAKMRDSVLQLASFEKTPDHLFDAAFYMKKDKIEGVSESIIMGQSMKVGTGAFQVVRRLNFDPGDVCRKETVFEDYWREESDTRRMRSRMRV